MSRRKGRRVWPRDTGIHHVPVGGDTHDGSCTLYNAESRERFTCRHLHEINMDWLVTVWERYLELCVEQDIWKGMPLHS